MAEEKPAVKAESKSKPSFACKFSGCGKKFAGGRALGSHYTENPSHRPAKPVSKRAKGKGAKGKPGRPAVAAGGNAVQAAYAAVKAEIAYIQSRLENLYVAEMSLKKLVGK